MEKIVYSERIRDLIDHLVRIKVIQKKKGYQQLTQNLPKLSQNYSNLQSFCLLLG